MKPFERGRKDFQTGQVVNPYSLDSVGGKEWERGFNLEYFNNLEKLNEQETRTGG